MRALFPFLAFDPVETPLSFATRLAHFHLRADVVSFLYSMGVKPFHLLGCEDHAIERLADIAGVEFAALQSNAARRIEKRRYDLRGNVLSAEFFSSPNTVFCPACLREDDGGSADAASTRRGRLDWTLRPVRTCARHGLALVSLPKQRWNDQFHELERRVPERGEALEEMVERAHRQLPSPLQNYVLARLDGTGGSTWLDSQTLEQAVRATEMLGMLILHGPSGKPSDLAAQGWDDAGRAGYAATSVGEAGIREALRSVQTKFRGKSGQAGCRKQFGAFYEWLSSSRSRKDPGAIMRILREHIFETMEVAPGEAVLGAALDERRLHSVASLAGESDLDPRTLRNVLVSKGLIPTDEHSEGHHVFDADTGRKVAASVQRLTHVISLPKALNCTRPQADQIVDEQLLMTISACPNAAAGRTGKAVDSKEIDRFLADLRACSREVVDVPTGFVPISKAAEKVKAPCVDIVHLVLGGFLSDVPRLCGVEGYAAILVDPDEVRIQIAALMTGLSASAAFARLNIPKSTGWSLVLRENAPHLKPLVVEGRNGRHNIYRFTEDVVAAFMSEFTTPARIATRYDLQIGVVVNHLKRCRIRPALARREVGIDFYRACDVPAFE
jgi:hypothetical protein